MNIEDIKKRNERRKLLSKERENEYSLIREIEYNRLVESSIEDNAYLLSIIEQSDTALSRIADLHIRGIEDRAAEPHRAIASDTLKAIRGN